MLGFGTSAMRDFLFKDMQGEVWGNSAASPETEGCTETRLYIGFYLIYTLVAFAQNVTRHKHRCRCRRPIAYNKSLTAVNPSKLIEIFASWQNKTNNNWVQPGSHRLSSEIKIQFHLSISFQFSRTHLSLFFSSPLSFYINTKQIILLPQKYIVLLSALFPILESETF